MKLTLNYHIPLILVILVVCGFMTSGSIRYSAKSNDIDKGIPSFKTNMPDDTNVIFLWRGKGYNKTLKKSVNSIFINEPYCKTISDPEKAALGFLATFIGNECEWDGDPKGTRSNLKCRILTALNLGYQCSDIHLGFLRKWFKNDANSLKELEDCPTTPDGSTIQDTFEKISLSIKGDIISVQFKATGINLREQKTWSWTETVLFKVNKDNIWHQRDIQKKTPKHWRKF